MWEEYVELVKIIFTLRQYYQVTLRQYYHRTSTTWKE